MALYALQLKEPLHASTSSLPLSVGSIYAIHLLSISWRFGFHEARLCFLKEVGHSLTPRPTDGPRHNTKRLSDSPHGKASVVLCLTLFFMLSDINNNVKHFFSIYWTGLAVSTRNL